MGFEMPSVTVRHEEISRYGAAYMVIPSRGRSGRMLSALPPGSDVVAERELFYDLARAMGGRLQLHRPPGAVIDMQRRPSTEGLLELLCGAGRVALTEVKGKLGGGVFRTCQSLSSRRTRAARRASMSETRS
jgi:hypothetical protein